MSSGEGSSGLGDGGGAARSAACAEVEEEQSVDELGECGGISGPDDLEVGVDGAGIAEVASRAITKGTPTSVWRESHIGTRNGLVPTESQSNCRDRGRCN